MKRYRPIAKIREDIQFQETNLKLFSRWPVTVADSQRLLAQYRAELAEALDLQQRSSGVPPEAPAVPVNTGVAKQFPRAVPDSGDCFPITGGDPKPGAVRPTRFQLSTTCTTCGSYIPDVVHAVWPMLDAYCSRCCPACVAQRASHPEAA